MYQYVIPLTFRATHVPVGDDQTQHLELTRDLAIHFNRAVKSRFFHLPEQIISACPMNPDPSSIEAYIILAKS